MKRNLYFGFLSILVMLFTVVLLVSASAAEYHLNVSSHTVNRGQTVEVKFDLSGDEVAGIVYDVEYDASVLTPILFTYNSNGDDGTGISNIQKPEFDPSAGEFTVVILGTSRAGDATVTFEVAEDAEITSYTISVSIVECCDNEGADLYPEVSNGTIIVQKNYYGADYSGSCGENVRWYLLESTGELKITGTGDMNHFSYDSKVPWHEHCSLIKKVVIDKGVTSIGSAVFMDCKNLTSVTIPGSVTSIGSLAFAYCSSLTSISIPNSVTSIGVSVFTGCSSLLSVDISENLTSISEGMFALCTSLTSVNIPDGIKIIGYQAFYSCHSLTNVGIPDSVKRIEGQAFYDCRSLTSIPLSDGLINIMYEAFAYCISLTEITIPESVKSIGEDIFYWCDKLETVYYNSSFSPADRSFLNIDSIKTVVFGGTIVPDNICLECTNLENISIADSVTKIGESAFKNCYNLTSVNIPDSVTMISNWAFYFCSNLRSVNIPDGVTRIGVFAFCGCIKLTNVTLPNSVTWIGDRAFEDCFSLTHITIPDSVTDIKNATFLNCKGLVSVTIPDSVTSIGDEAFALCSSLTSVTIGNGVTRIGSWAFFECTNLENLSIGNSVTTIDHGAFSCCAGLQSVEIPDSVTSIVNNAFALCSSLTNVTIGNGVTTIGAGAFLECTNLENLSIGNGVTTIDTGAFSYCTGLQSVEIPDSVTSIGNNAFSYCHGLTSVMISESVTSIGDGAFIGCANLENATVWENSYAHTHFESNYPNINLNVVAHTTGIYLNYKELLLKIGSTKALTASVEPCNAYNNNVIWSSSDDSIVSVDENGKITRLTEGTVTITATTEEGGFTASCTLYDYTVSYDTNGGSGEFVEHFKGFNDDVALPLEFPTKSGYTFMSWLGSDGETYAAGDTYSGNADLILTASWKANTYKVTFDARDGEVSTSEITVTYDEVFGTLPVATKENCVFDGWYLDEECAVKVTEETVVKLEKDSVLYASFKPIRIIGDTNCDGKIDTKDVVLLAQHLAKWTVTIDEVAADCNADGKIDTKDVVLLAQHLAKWAVTLG